MTHQEAHDLARSLNMRLAITIDPDEGSSPRVNRPDTMQVWEGDLIVFETLLFAFSGWKFEAALNTVGKFLKLERDQRV